MSACRRGCQTNLVALALYSSECQFRTVAPGLVGRQTGPGPFALVSPLLR